MVARSTNKIWKISIVFLIILLIKVNAIVAGEVYVPKPIIFIHGLNDDAGTWDSTKNNLKKYFIDEITGLPKYDYPNASTKWYYPKCDYESMNTGDIPTIAQSKLIGSIYAGLEALNDIPDCVTKKVDIVGHSMGGLITRSLLKRNDLQNSIDKVIFIGTPHNGSPYASALWLLNRVAKDELSAPIKQNTLYFSKPVFSIFGFSANNIAVFKDLGDKLSSRYNNISLALSFAKKAGLDPDSYAIDELRLNQDVSYHSVISGFAGMRIKSVVIDATYNGSTVFLSPARNNLATPKTYKTTVGINTSNNNLWGLGKILEFDNAFSFPMGETLSDVSKNGGDGIVSLNSQWSLGHTDAVINGITHLDEPAQASAILNALDDSPVIENVRVLGANKYANGPGYFVYVIIRVKEYLLADIEISSMTVDGDPVALSEFYDNGHYKPYKKFGKSFLRERLDSDVLDIDEHVVTLRPGEFYVRLYLEGDEPHVVNIDLKNPSDNPHATASLTIQRPIISNENPTGIITSTRPTIEAQIQSLCGTYIYRDSLVMRVNGSVVSHTTSGFDSKINIRYTPDDDLDDGQYTVTVDGKDIWGIPAEQKEWTFTIQTQRPIVTDETPKGDIIDTRPTISARIYSPVGTPINLSSLNMELDGYTISHSTSGSGSDIAVFYTPPSDLSSATHTARLYGQDINGLSASKTWTFTVKSGYFMVEIPAKISISQDFTMKVTACNGLGQVLDGQEGRALYDEDADITISGSPAPQGSLTVTHINAGEWVNGVWQTTNQCYSSSTEEKYKLTITVTDSGGNHAGMTGSADTIVGPLELAIEIVGNWGINVKTGDWQDFYEKEGFYTSLFSMISYGSSANEYGGPGDACAAYLYKIQIPAGSHINHIDITLTRSECNVNPYGTVSTVNKQIGYFLANSANIEPSAYPPNIPAELNMDYSFNLPSGFQTPVGSYNLVHEVIGGDLRLDHGSHTMWGGCGWKQILTYLPVETFVKTIPINDPGVTTVWLSMYPANIKSMKIQIEPHATACLQNQPWTAGRDWFVLIWTQYGVSGVYGYNK